MLTLGIPCVCIELLGIALQIANLWVIDPLPTFNDIRSTSTNEYSTSIQAEKFVSNQDPRLKFDFTNRYDIEASFVAIGLNNNTEDQDNAIVNRYSNFAIQPTKPDIFENQYRIFKPRVFNPITFEKNEWEILNLDLPIISIIDLQNEYVTSIGNNSFVEIRFPLDNIYDVTAELRDIRNRFNQTENKWINVGSPINNRTLPKNQWVNEDDTTSIRTLVIKNEWSVDTFAQVAVQANNLWENIAFNIIKPFDLLNTVINEYDTNGTPIRIFKAIPENQYLTTIEVKPNIRNTTDNIYDNIGVSVNPFIQTIAINEYVVDAGVPDKVGTGIGQFRNSWDTDISIDDRDPVCPVPCGMPTPVSRIRFKDIKIAQVTEVT